jgi:ice-binding like protein/putative Ig domain-containing protein
MGVMALAVGIGSVLMIASPATAATTIDGPINLGSASTFGVLGASEVTNSGASIITGDLGISPAAASFITGFPPGIVTGTVYAPPGTEAANAQSDTTIAYDVAASLSPMASGLSNLSGVLSPGVYSGVALTVNGALELAGGPDSVWVFQADSSLITATGSNITLSGGASACNVFWKVGSSATLAGGSTMVGTILALTSISTTTGPTALTVNGRLLARNGAVTLNDTVVTVPTACTTPAGTVGTSPTITTGAPTEAQRGVPYQFDVDASGTSGTVFTVTSGGLPAGLSLDSSTGVISGTPASTGTFPVTISADNGIAPAATASYRLVVLDILAETGVDARPAIEVGGAALIVGIVLLVLSRRRRAAHRS